MNLYYFIFIWILFMWLLSNFIKATNIETVLENKEHRYKLLFSLIVFTPVFLLASMGDPIGDTPAYLLLYEKLPNNIWEGLSVIRASTDSGKGFTLLGIIIKSLFGEDIHIYRICLALIHSIPIILIYRKYSTNYLLSIYLFVASASHIGWMMNGLRQFTAVVIIFSATSMLIERKYKKLILIILLATTIHTSAIIMLPVVFIVQGKAWNKKTILFIILALIGMYAFSNNEMLLDQMLVGTEYSGMNSSWRALGDNGVNPIRVLVNAIPTMLAFAGRKIIQREDDKLINVCINMSIITCGLYLVGMVTSGITVGRLPIYTSLYNFILLPYLVKTIFTKQSSKIMLFIMVGAYFLYYVVETM